VSPDEEGASSEGKPPGSAFSDELRTSASALAGLDQGGLAGLPSHMRVIGPDNRAARRDVTVVARIRCDECNKVAAEVERWPGVRGLVFFIPASGERWTLAKAAKCPDHGEPVPDERTFDALVAGAVRKAAERGKPVTLRMKFSNALS
jgi:hypothetical protein